MGSKYISHMCSFASYLLLGALLSNCTEPFTPDFTASDEVLVVEARITNEQKIHEINLSRSGQEETSAKTETNATVMIIDGNQQIYSFTEIEPGKYTTNLAFAAQANITYQLVITTADGVTYSSTSESLTNTTQIDEVYASRANTDSGLDGVEIFVDSFDPSGNSTYYKYEFEETYKIIAPNWGPDELVIVSETNRAIGIVRRTEEERICFASEKSNSIVITNTTGAGEDRVSKFAVRFLSRDNFVISHRYSILVKQYVLSQQAFAYYEKLQDFSGSESLFSQSQPGFINGNINSDANNERVVGFFEVASVSEKRAFFNYADLFPGEDLPPFVEDCRRTNFLRANPIVFDLVKANTVSYVGNVTDPFTGALLEYIVVPRVCGDCNVLGSSEVPDFWEE